MYHDQGQIAMKLMGFDRGVTLHGGLPVPVATCASGTAFDIVGKNVANAEGLQQAFELTVRIAAAAARRADGAAAGRARRIPATVRRPWRPAARSRWRPAAPAPRGGTMARCPRSIPTRSAAWRNPGATRATTTPEETREWADALAAVVRRCGRERGLFLLKRLEEQAQELGVVAHVPPHSAYQNTIPLGQQAPYPGDLALEQRITSIIRWNALAMVMRANQASGELGGHVASYASAAEIFEVGFNHFFRAPHDGHARRPRVLPAALGARRLCARVPRRRPRARSSSPTTGARWAAGACARIRIRG